MKIKKIKEEKSTLFDFHENEVNNPDQFLAEELLIPKVNSCDSQRGNMRASHDSQIVMLKNNEFPRVFTRYENQVGEYSCAYKKADEDMKIIAKIRKNAYNEILIVQRKNKVYDVIKINKAVKITEDYGYGIDNCVQNLDEGDTIYKDDYIFKSSNYDDDGNFMRGTNLRAVYIPWDSNTYEDGIVLTKSGAEKLTAHKVEKTTVGINTNEVLLNLYQRPDDYGYHSIPKVGEIIYNDKILVASRREDSQSILYNFQLNKINKVDPSDQIYYSSGGTIVDINIFSNLPLEKIRMRKNEFQSEVCDLYEQQYEYYKEILSVLDKIIIPLTEEEYVKRLTDEELMLYRQERKEYQHYYVRPLPKSENPNEYSDELAYLWKYAHQFVDEKISWRADGSKFDNFKIEFTVLKENPISVGSKLSGNYGNKGVVSKIIEDSEAPYDPVADIRADIILNPLGVINRQNISQSYEQLVNHIAENVQREMKKLYEQGDYNEALDLYLEYSKRVSPDQYDFMDMKSVFVSRKEKEEMVKEMVEDGIYTCVPPFYNNVQLDDLVEMFKDKPEWLAQYNCQDIERPQTIGFEYFIRLKHEVDNKNSVRAAGALNIRNQPYKSKLKKEKKALINDNAVRLGDMESLNLMMAKRPDIVSKLFRMYSTTESMRHKLIETLLTADNPMKVSVEDNGDISITRNMLDKYLAVLELRLED